MFAQALNVPGGIPGMVIWLIVICGVIGIGLVVVRACGIKIPGWVIQIFWIVIVVVVAIFAIKLILSIV